MRKYYLVAESDDKSHIHVHVTDALGSGRLCLLEIEATSYAEAVKKVRFSAHSMGKTAFCGVSIHGEPFADIC